MSFEVTFVDATAELVEDADSYEMEGPMTTFFLSNGRHSCLSSWATRVASFRTDRVLRIRRLEEAQVVRRAHLDVV